MNNLYNQKYQMVPDLESDPQDFQTQFTEQQEVPEMEQMQQPVEQTKPQPEEPQVDPMFQQALEQREKQRRYSDLLRMFEGISDASLPGIQSSVGSMADRLEKRADEPVEVYKQVRAQQAAAKKSAMEEKEANLRMDEFQMRLQKSKLDFQDMEANRNPKSPQSQIAQDRVLEMQAKLGQPVNEAQVRSRSGAELFQMFDYLKEDLTNHYKNENAKLDREARAESDKAALAMKQAELQHNKAIWQEGETRRQKEQQRREEKDDDIEKRNLSKDIYGVVKDYEKDETVKALKKESLGFAQADQLIQQIESGNEVALGALGTKMARAMGEVGVLTESDVSRYIEAQSVIQKLKDKFGRAFMGKVSEQTMKDIKEVNAKMKEGFKARKAEIQEKYINYAYQNFGKAKDMTPEQVAEKFGFDSKLSIQGEQQKAPHGDVVERNGKKYKWNSTVGKYQLAQ